MRETDLNQTEEIYEECLSLNAFIKYDMNTVMLTSEFRRKSANLLKCFNVKDKNSDDQKEDFFKCAGIVKKIYHCMNYQLITRYSEIKLVRLLTASEHSIIVTENQTKIIDLSKILSLLFVEKMILK